MVYSVGYAQRRYPKKKDINAEKLGGQWKLKDWNVTV